MIFVYTYLIVISIVGVILTLKIDKSEKYHIKNDREIAKAIAELKAKNKEYDEKFNDAAKDLNVLYKRTSKVGKVKK